MQRNQERSVITTSSRIEINSVNCDQIRRVRWWRKNVEQSLVLKNLDLFDFGDWAYSCTIFDYSSTIEAELEMKDGSKQIQHFGPVQIDPTLLQQANIQNKSPKGMKIKVLSQQEDNAWWGFLRVVEARDNIVSLNLYVCQSIFPLFISFNQDLDKNLEVFRYGKTETSLEIVIGETETKLKKFLGRQATTLKLQCETRLKRDLLIFLCLQEIFLKKQKTPENREKKNVSKISFIQYSFDDLFSSRDDLIAQTPEVGQHIIKDIGKVIYTPCQDDFDFKRDQAFLNFEKFITEEHEECSEAEEEQKKVKIQTDESQKLGGDLKNLTHMTNTQETSFATLSFSSLRKKKNSLTNENENIVVKEVEEKKQKDENIFKPFKDGFTTVSFKKVYRAPNVSRQKQIRKIPSFLRERSVKREDSRFKTCENIQKPKWTPKKKPQKNKSLSIDPLERRKSQEIKRIISREFIRYQKKNERQETANGLKRQYLIGDLSEKNLYIPHHFPLKGKNKAGNSHRRTETSSENPLPRNCVNKNGQKGFVKFCYPTTLLS